MHIALDKDSMKTVRPYRAERLFEGRTSSSSISLECSKEGSGAPSPDSRSSELRLVSMVMIYIGEEEKEFPVGFW